MVLSAVAAVLSMSSCHEEYTTYKDAEYVMFADTLSTNVVEQGNEVFGVTIASTVACDYDRNFGVEVVDNGSNAVEGKHFELLTNTVTIPAGEKLDMATLMTTGVAQTMQLVPEPTTATLSLLALAGLAARRRRK